MIDWTNNFTGLVWEYAFPHYQNEGELILDEKEIEQMRVKLRSENKELDEWLKKQEDPRQGYDYRGCEFW